MIQKKTAQRNGARPARSRDNTERKRAEEALRASEATYQAIFNAANEGILVLDMDTGQVVDANATFCTVFGYTPEETRGLRVEEFSSGEAPYIQEDALRLIRQAARGEQQRFEWPAKSRDGRLLWIDVTLKRATIAGRDCVLAIGREITERKRAEEALRESEERYRLLAENVTDVIWTADLDLNLTYISPSDQLLTGYAPQERIGLTAKEALTPTSLEAAEAALAEELAIEGREQKDLTRSRTMEVEVYRKDGSTVWAEMKITFLRDQDGRPVGLLGVTRDITERKRAEQALRESKERYRLLAENVTDVIWTADMDLNFTYISPSRQLLGHAPGQPMPQRVEEALTPASFEIAMKALAEELATESMDEKELSRSRTLELENYRSDGSTVWVEDRMTFLRDPDGRPVGILGVTRDITERKRAEETLRETRDYLEKLIDYANAPIIVWDPNFTITRFNHAFERLTGRPAGEVAGQRLEVLFPEAERAASMEQIVRALRGEFWELIEISILHQNGEVRRVLWNSANIAGPDGRTVVATIAQGTDITERKQAEEALRETTQTLQALIQASPLAILTMDLQGNVRTWNPAAERTFGWSEQEALGRPNPIIPEDRQNEFRALLDAVLQGNLFSKAETRRGRKDGSLIDVSLSTAAMRNATGDIIGVMSMLDDITERKRAEEALRESERRFRTLSEESFEGIAIHRKGRILEANQPLATMFGYELSEVPGMHALDFTAPESRDLVLQSILSKSREPFEFTGLRKDGTTFPVEVCGRPIPYQGMMVTVASLRDITEHKQAEEALQKAREELEARVERQMEQGNPYGLTFRELTVLHLVAAGKADKEIGGQLGITTLTASKHLANILSKMGAASRTEACVRALREGLLD